MFPAAEPPVAPVGAGPYAMVDGAGRLLAVYERRDERLKPSVVLNVDGGTGAGGD